MSISPRLGRPRDAATHAAILRAALALTARVGYAKLTVDGIAAEAGVGKQTLYRWWPGKADIVLEAFASDAAAVVTLAETADWAVDLETMLGQVIRRLSGPSGAIFKSLLAEALLNDTFREKFRATYLSGRVEQIADVIRRRPNTSTADAERMIELIYGAIWYRMANGLPLSRGFAKQLTQAAQVTLDAKS